MDKKENRKEENYDFIYEDYFEAEKGDVDDLIFALIERDKTHSEKWFEKI